VPPGATVLSAKESIDHTGPSATAARDAERVGNLTPAPAGAGAGAAEATCGVTRATTGARAVTAALAAARSGRLALAALAWVRWPLRVPRRGFGFLDLTQLVLPPCLRSTVPRLQRGAGGFGRLWLCVFPGPENTALPGDNAPRAADSEPKHTSPVAHGGAPSGGSGTPPSTRASYTSYS
jgi:hypothetical protein